MLQSSPALDGFVMVKFVVVRLTFLPECTKDSVLIASFQSGKAPDKILEALNMP